MKLIFKKYTLLLAMLTLSSLLYGQELNTLSAPLVNKTILSTSNEQ